MGESPGTPTQSGPPYHDKREVPRFSFIAEVTVTEIASNTRISGRISEISRKGCYIDVLNTLPEGTTIHVRISRDKGGFECNGKIIYAQPGMGMGVAFAEIPADQLKLLDAWLAELQG